MFVSGALLFDVMKWDIMSMGTGKITLMLMNMMFLGIIMRIVIIRLDDGEIGEYGEELWSW